MKKKIIAIVLSVALVLGMIPVISLASSGDAYYVGKGDRVYYLSADESTGTGYEDLGFGTKANDGRIWTDKSVETSGTGFDVTLSALAQEYVSTASTTGSTSTAADVVFVLDFTGSMTSNTDITKEDGTSETRLQALVDAFNIAADIITNANPDNRILVYAFGGGANSEQCVEFMPLGHYENSSFSGTGTTDKYISLSSSSSGSSGGSSGRGGNQPGGSSSGSGTYTVKTASGLTKDGSSYSNSQSTITGTDAEYGIANGVKGLADKIASDTSTTPRKPYVIFMTDGAASVGDSDWYSDNPASDMKNGDVSGDKDNGTKDCAAVTILTAAYWKDKLQTAYDSYNTNNGNSTNSVEWFNIGLAIDDSSVDYISSTLKPSLLLNSADTKASDVISSIKSYASKYTAKNYAEDENYVYITSDYCFFCDTQELMNTAFTKLASIIEQGSAAISYPIVASEIGGMTEGMVFTDKLGDGMSIDGLTLCYNGGDNITGTLDETTGTYTFEGFDTTAVITEEDGVQTLTWNLPADEISMFTFADRKDTENGGYVSAVPTTLKYHLSFSETDSVTYTNAIDSDGNALTTVEYAIPGDNSYYFDVTTSTDGSSVIFESSTLRTGIDEDTAKGKNITETDSDVARNTFTASGEGTADSMCSVKTALGNNGKVEPIAKISKTVDKTETPSGTEVTYTTTVESLTDDSFKYTVTDKYATTEDNAAEETETGSSGTPVEVTETVTGDVGDVIPGYTPVITKIGDETVHYDDGEGTPTADSDLDVTIVEELKYKVTYSWSGDIPTDAALPSDVTDLADGTAYTIDTTYVSGTHYYSTVDAYGNEISYYAFSGWNKTDGTIAGADVAVAGEWTKTEVTPDKHTITYSMTGEVPEGTLVPTDNAEYVKGQSYIVDSTLASGTTVPHYDDYGNEDGYYTFSGWTDPNGGTMGDSDVTITGKWTYTPESVDTHTVTYEWTGAPETGVKLPEDGNKYVKGQDYTVDTTYSSTTVIPACDDYGNLNGNYTFSGWDTKDGKMGDSNITIKGKWAFTSVDVPANSVTYIFTGKVPAGKDAPIDKNTYVNGQTYTVDTTYKAGDTIEITDDYGNVTGVYTFKGWQDPNVGVMDEDGVAITGEWTYDDVDVPTHNVTYTFTGDVPAGKDAPTDGTDYVKGQSYTIDTTFVKGDTIEITDAYGNVTGVYTFEGWDTKDGKMGDTDVAVTGEWTYDDVDVPTHNVTYTFTGDVPAGKDAPIDKNTYVNGQRYTVDTTFSKGDTVEVTDDYGNVTGVYTFKGWTDPNDGKMDSDGVAITGEWTYDDVDVPTHNVTYTFTGDVPAGKDAPIDKNTYVNGQTYTVDTTYNKGDVIEVKDSYGNTVATYTFEGWQVPNDGKMDEDGVVITGNWVYADITLDSYTITYAFSGNVPASASIPIDDTSYVNGQPYTVSDKYKAGDTIETTDDYGNVTGVYTFLGWDTADGNMGDDDLTITGTWSYTPESVDTHTVTYEWTGAPETGVKLPEDGNKYVKGQHFTVDAEYTSATVVPTYDAYGNLNGKYTFSGWDTKDGEMGDSDITVKGSWTYGSITVVPNTVTYIFTGKVPAGKDAPIDKNTYVNGQTYTVDTTYSKGDTIEITDDYGNVTGVYTFKGWTDPNDGKMDSDGVAITGEWTYDYVDVPTHNVTYTFTGKVPAGKDAPTDGTDYVKGQSYTIDTTFVKGDTIEITDSYGNVTGVYTFLGWDTKDGKMGDTDVAVTGEWTYDDVDVPTYTITYSFTGDVPEGVIPPEDKNSYVPGQTYTISSDYTTGYIIPHCDDYGNTDGYYTFEGWNDPNDGTMGDSNLPITGTWTYTETPVIPNTVTYMFTGTVPADKTAPVDSNTYVKGQTYTVDTTYKAGDVINHYDAYGNVDGKYTFEGWVDSNSGKMDEDGVTITGNWTYEDVEVPTHTITVPGSGDDDDPDATPDKEIPVINGAIMIVDPNNGSWNYNDNSYTDKTEIPVTSDITLADPTRDGYGFTGWVITYDDSGVATATAQWESTTRTVSYNGDTDDTPEKTVVPVGSTVTIDPNSGKWTYGGETYTGTTEITVDEDTVIPDPTRTGYTFTGWTETTVDGKTILTAGWTFNPEVIDDTLQVVVPTAVIGGGTAAVIGGAITAGVVTGAVIALPIVIAGAVIAYKVIEDKKADNTDTSSGDSGNAQNNGSESSDDSDIPYTGSRDMTVIILTLLVALYVAAIELFVIHKRKKNHSK